MKLRCGQERKGARAQWSPANEVIPAVGHLGLPGHLDSCQNSLRGIRLATERLFPPRTAATTPPEAAMPEGSLPHPRPQLRRRDWQSLDGEWAFALDPDARWSALW